MILRPDVDNERELTESKSNGPEVTIPVEHNMFDWMLIFINCFRSRQSSYENLYFKYFND